MRLVRTRVLPDPGPARTMTGPGGVVTAFRCSLFRFLSIGDRGALPAGTVDIPSCCTPFPRDSSDWRVASSPRLQKDLGSARGGGSCVRPCALRCARSENARKGTRGRLQRAQSSPPGWRSGEGISWDIFPHERRRPSTALRDRTRRPRDGRLSSRENFTFLKTLHYFFENRQDRC